ncbi:MAG: M48 family metalloprotease [Pseudomonadota bacterium]|nr:M48 family metalloprotease [Pseudomonadota bacterium]
MTHRGWLLGALTFCLMIPGQGGAVDLGTLFNKANEMNLGGLIQQQIEVSNVDTTREVEIGQRFAATLLGGAPLVNNPGVQRYVNELGSWLALQAERPDLTFHFGVLDTPTVNAFATPGGYIFITRGLLERLNNETELAGVLSHEIAHVVARHHLAAAQKQANLDFAGAVLGQALAGKENEALLTQLSGVARNLYSRGLDKQDEFEADRMGVVIAARAGYDPYGLPVVLQTLESLDPGDDALTLMFKTHPTPADRLTRLLNVMMPLDRYAGASDLNADFDQVLATLTAPPSGPQGDPLVRAVQAELAAKGYDPGPADGLMGNKTRQAIALYQSRNGLVADAVASQQLLSHLQASGQGQQPGNGYGQPPASAAQPSEEVIGEQIGREAGKLLKGLFGR